MGFSSGLDGRDTVLGHQKQIAMRTRLGIWTAALLVTSALGAFAAPAVAPNCRTIESANARLSCYDAAFPPKTQNPAEAGTDVPRGYKDPFLAEEARTAAKLKNICRGC
jgi:hypothetical protein